MLAPILSIQSHVVYGHVGNAAAVFPLQRLGREVWPLMSVQFSSHTGYPGWRGRAFDAGMIDDCVERPRGDRRASAVRRAPDRLPRQGGDRRRRRCARLPSSAPPIPDAAWCCDPVIGDVGRGALCRAGGRGLLPRPRAPRRDDRHAERLRARMADRDAPRRPSREARAAVARAAGARAARRRRRPRSRSTTRPPDASRHSRRRRERRLARAHAEAADRRQRRGRSVRGAVLPSLARGAGDARGAVAGRVLVFGIVAATLTGRRANSPSSTRRRSSRPVARLRGRSRCDPPTRAFTFFALRRTSCRCSGVAMARERERS